MRVAVAIALLCACHRSPEKVRVAVAPVAPAVPVVIDPVAKGVPHGSPVVRVAVTERGDAALTVDSDGSVRLWPSFDGGRPPVVVSAHAPAEVALTWVGNDLLAVIRDNAGAVGLQRLGRDGRVRSHAQLPGEVGYTQVIAFDGSVLARTADQAIEWFTADGVRRGRVVGEPGHRIVSIAARRGAAVALIEHATESSMRWLSLGTSLGWGDTTKLPVHAVLLALSPDHHRAAVYDIDNRVSILDVQRGARVLPVTGPDAVDASVLGFIDDEHVAAIGRSIKWTIVLPRADTTDLTIIERPLGGSAIADELVVTGIGKSLGLTDEKQTRYLGYRAIVDGDLVPAGDQVALRLGASRYLWIDDKLQLQRDVEFSTLVAPKTNSLGIIPIGDHSAIVEELVAGALEISFVDLAHPSEKVALGKYFGVEAVDYSASTQLFGIVAQAQLGLTTKLVTRFKLDLATNTAQRLEPLAVGDWINGVHLLDPDRADGLVAIVAQQDEAHNFTMIRAGGTTRKVKLPGQLIRIGDDGAIYSTDQRTIWIRRSGSDKVVLVSLRVTSPETVAVDSTGAHIAVIGDRELVMLDRDGALLWRAPLWLGRFGPRMLFSRDDKTLLVRGHGMLAFDVATGARTAMECAWGFGLMTEPPYAGDVNSPTVCEDR